MTEIFHLKCTKCNFIALPQTHWLDFGKTEVEGESREGGIGKVRGALAELTGRVDGPCSTRLVETGLYCHCH